MGDAASTAFAVLVGIVLLMLLYAGIIVIVCVVAAIFVLFAIALSVNAVVEWVRGLLSR